MVASLSERLPLASVVAVWRKGLEDASAHVDLARENGIEIERAALEAGHLPVPVVEALGNGDKGPTIQVWIAPVVLMPCDENGIPLDDERRALAPFWIKAQANREGVLSPLPKALDDAFLIERGCLAPLASEAPTFAARADVESTLAALRKEDRFKDAAIDWATLWQAAGALSEKLFGRALGDWENVPGFVACGALVFYKDPKSRDPATSLKNLAKALEARKVPPVLLAGLLGGRASRDVKKDAEARAARRERHFGQIGANNALNEDQRDALAATMAAPKGSVVAVMGPPGTGKTALLQSVVASLWVERALARGEPPVIVATSTNNQAITNILESFAHATLPEGHALFGSTLAKRWIPDCEGYGVWFPSESKIDKAKAERRTSYFVSGKNADAWERWPHAIDDEAFVERAKNLWLSSFAAWKGTPESDMQAGIAFLHERLAALDSKIRALWAARDACVFLWRGFEDVEEARVYIRKARARVQKLESDQMELRKARLRIFASYDGFWRFLTWMPWARRKLWREARAVLIAKKLADPTWPADAPLSLAQVKKAIDARAADLKSRCDRRAAELDPWHKWASLLKGVFPKADPVLFGFSDESFQKHLDLTLRVEMFQIAARYWEGRWISENEALFAERDPKQTLLWGRSLENCQNRWRRIAKLTPCMVATVYRVASLFDFYIHADRENCPLVDFIDLLIVEEAGQVASNVGLLPFALASRALVVGDAKQIEPVFGVSQAIEGGNLSDCGLGDKTALWDRLGFSGATSSVMQAAQGATAFAIGADHGIFLREHWRCRASTIAYCNDLAYGGRLVSMRGDDPYPLPPLGYANVAGAPKRVGTSWENKAEAEAIATWIAKHADELARGLPLNEVVAVVTPFKSQALALRAALRRKMPGISLVVDTVHALQGAETDVVIFSPTYTEGCVKHAFYDQKVNMLNVAVSRAKQSFLAFGDMRLFNAAMGRAPSSLLARRLFADPANEILDVEPTPLFIDGEGPALALQRIDTLEAHRALLRRALTEAKDRVLIASPFVIRAAVDADQLFTLFENAIARNVRVVVAYDPSRLAKTNDFGARFVLDELEKRNVELWPALIHSKTLAVDAHWIAEGSFNWLSASRVEGGPSHRLEASLIVEGREALAFIEAAWTYIERKRVLRRS